MHLRIQSYPPLGQITTTDTGNVSLTVVLEVPKGNHLDQWQVAVWRSVDGSEWTDQALSRLESDNCPFSFHALSATATSLYFTSTLSFTSRTQFTLKLRRGFSEPWGWAADVCNLGDGIIILSQGEMVLKDASLPLPDLGKAWEVTRRKSQSRRTSLWALEADVPGSQNDESSFRTLPIGKPWGSFLR